MKRFSFVFFVVPLFCYSISFAADADNATLKSIERRITKEPQYELKPQYVLLALGPEAKTLLWLVEDNRKLYVDQNANGDLTDDGPPIVPSNQRELGTTADSQTTRWDFDYMLPEFTPTGRPTQKDFQLRRWNYGESAGDEYGLSLTLDGAIPMYAGWFTSFWAASPDEASIIHFGGPLTPRLLRYQEFIPGTNPDRLSVAFMNDGLGRAATSRLSIDAIAADVVPVVHIRWPTKDGYALLETTHRLDHRCCYWEFYTVTFGVPKEAVPGTAELTIELPVGAMPLALTTNKISAPVVAAETKTGPK